MTTCNHQAVDSEFVRFIMIFPMGEATCRECQCRLSLHSKTRWAAWGVLVLGPALAGLLFSSIWAYGIATGICVLYMYRILARASLVAAPLGS